MANERESTPTAAQRDRGDGESPRSRLDTTEQRLLEQWRAWQKAPSTQPPWAQALRRRLSGPNRLHGMLLGAAAGEAFVHSGGRVGERSTAMLFVLEGMLRARADSSDDPLPHALSALQRWMHTRGVAWRDCVPEAAAGSPGSGLVEQSSIHERTSDDPAMLIALARIAAGEKPGGSHADSATSVPLGGLAALWHDDADAVYSLGTELAAMTHGHPHGSRPAGVLGVILFWLLRGHPLVDSAERGLSQWAPPTLSYALRLGVNRPADFLPGARQIAAMGSGRTGLEVLGVALRAATASPDDFTEAVRIAASHDGDRASCAAVCGQVLGALHGPSAIPGEWLERLRLRPLAERLAEEAVSEFGEHPDHSGDVDHYRTGLATTSRVEVSRNRFVGSVLGCAIGEALGVPVTADSWDEIRSRHGADGLTDYIPAGHPAGRLGSGTQLLLFSVEGMIRANVARRSIGAAQPHRYIQHAYQRWLHTQHLSWPRAAGEFLADTPEPDGWLVQQRTLFQTRNPGRTMMRTLIAFAKGQQAMGTPSNPVSDSAGSTAVTRAVAAALWSDDPTEVFSIGMAMAALTHGDPVAYLSAGALALLVARLLRGDDLPTAAEAGLDNLTVHNRHSEVSSRISAAMRLGAEGFVAPEKLTRNLGSGATAAEALGIGLYAALVSDGDFDRALSTAVNHSGNSASTGAVCGGLVGAMVGCDAIPQRWLTDLELRAVVHQLAQDAAAEFGPRPPQQPDWFDRYPAT